MATGQTDFEHIIAAMKAQPPPAREIAASHPTSKVSRQRHPRPRKPETGGADPLSGNTAFGAATAGQKAAAELLAKPFVIRKVFLDKPFLIWQSGDQPDSKLEQFLDSRIAPFSSWAQMYLYTEGGSFNTNLTFYYLWTNESPELAGINIEAPFLVTGSAFARGSAAFFGGNTTSVFAVISLRKMRWIGWGTDPMNGAPLDQTYYPGFQQSEQASIVSLTATGGWGFGSPRESSQTFDYQQFDLHAKSVVVPPGASLMLQLWVNFQCSTEGDTLTDQAWIAFGGPGDFVSSPYILLSVYTAA